MLYAASDTDQKRADASKSLLTCGTGLAARGLMAALEGAREAELRRLLMHARAALAESPRREADTT